MAIYTKNFEEFEDLTAMSRELIFHIQHLKDKIQIAGFFSVWAFVILLSTLYTDGLQTLVFKLALCLFIGIFILLLFFIIQRAFLVRQFNSTLQSLKKAEKAMDSHLANLTNSVY